MYYQDIYLEIRLLLFQT